jgi:hypothetical protein
MPPHTLTNSIAVLVVGAAMAGCGKPPLAAKAEHDGIQPTAGREGASPMTRDRLLEQIRPLDQAQVEALASSLALAARAAPQAAVELSLGADEDASIKAKRFLLQMEDLAIVPWLEAPNPASPEHRVLVIAQSVDAELALRRKVIARIDKLLDDRTPVAVRTTGPAEQKPPRRRVCDEAYLLMRQMVHFGEPPMEAGVQASMFLNAPADFKDAQIKKARASNVWNRAITGKDVEDYAESHPDLAAPAPPPGHGLPPRR